MLFDLVQKYLVWLSHMTYEFVNVLTLLLLPKLIFFMVCDVTFAQPLLKVSMSLKDALILVLRKAMFSRYYSNVYWPFIVHAISDIMNLIGSNLYNIYTLPLYRKLKKTKLVCHVIFRRFLLCLLSYYRIINHWLILSPNKDAC